MEYFINICTLLGLLSSLLSIIPFFRKKIKEYKFAGIILVIFIIISTILNAYLLASNNKYISARLSITRFLEQNNYDIEYYKDGELKGIINGGLMLLEKYKDIYPEQYNENKEIYLKYLKVDNGAYTMDDVKEYYIRRNRLEEGAGAMIKIIKTLNNLENK